jgi:hypothetical protein
MTKNNNEIDIHEDLKRKEIFEAKNDYFKSDQEIFSSYKAISDSSLIFEHEVMREIKRSSTNYQKLAYGANDKCDSEGNEGLLHSLII